MNKKKYCLALAALMLVACNNEDPFSGGPVNTPGLSGRNEVRLTIPGVGSGVVPYAIATENENRLDDFDVYVFGEDTVFKSGNFLLEEVFRSVALGGTGTDRTATISLVGTNKKRIYYVANSYTGSPRKNIASLDSVELNVTTTTTFRQKITDAIPVHLSCPLLMTDSTVVDDVATVVTNGIEVNLQRSMARFDVINRKDDSNFTIEWIEIYNARSQAYVFPSTPAYASALIEKMQRIDFTVLPDANDGETNSAFYLYPTVKAGEGSLALGGTTSGGVKALYPVRFEDGSKMVQIEANKRYVVEVLSLGTVYVNATIKVAEWLVGDTIRSEVGNGTIKLSLHKDATGTFNENTLVIAAATGTESIIDVECDSEWEFVETPSWIDVDTTGYSLNNVAKSFKLTANTANPSGKTKRTGVLTLRNKKRPSITQPLIVKQEENKASSIDFASARLANNAIVFSGGSDSTVITVDLGGSSAPASYTYELDAAAQSFLTAETSESLLKVNGLKYLKLKASANATTDTIKGLITFTAGDLKQVIEVVNSPKLLNSIKLNVPSLSGNKISLVATSAKAIKVDVTSNSDWKVEKAAVVSGEDDSWLTVSPTSGTNNGSFTLTADDNTAATERSVKITVSYTVRPEIKQEFMVTQAGKAMVHTVETDINTVSIDPSGVITSGEITVTSSEAWTAVLEDTAGSGTTPDWVAIDKTSGATGEKITVSMVSGQEENTGAEQRKAYITVTNNGVTAQVEITQAGTI